MSVTISNTTYQFSSDEYFGNGLIISNKCDYSFQYLHDDLPLIQCYDNYLELNRYKKRGIYTLDIHTCISDGSDMTVSNMKNNVYVVCILSIINYKSKPILLDSFPNQNKLLIYKHIYTAGYDG